MKKSKKRTQKGIVFCLFLALVFQSCTESKIIENSFLSSQDTLRIKMSKVQGMGLFLGGAGRADFKDLSNEFANNVTYPEGIDSIQRLELMVDYKPKMDTTYIEILKGIKNGVPVFVVDENYNKDFRDDMVREYKEMDWKSTSSLIKCDYMIFNGEKMVRDSSWLKIGLLGSSLWLGKSEHHKGKLTIDKEEFTVATTEPRNPNSMSYLFDPRIAIISKSKTEKESIGTRDILEQGEVLDFNGKYYRFVGITNDGSFITLVKDLPLAEKTGTQVGMMAPEYSVVSRKGDTLQSKGLQDKITILANSCGCGGDKESTKAVSDIKKQFGDKAHVLQVDTAIKEELNTYQIDTDRAGNEFFYETYRKQYCSRITYVIGKDRRIIDKFKISKWKEALPEILN